MSSFLFSVLVSAAKNIFGIKRKDISDAYINWLCFANAGMLDRGNLHCFNYAAENLPSNNPVIEIGSFCGLSTNIIAYYLAKNKKRNKIISCDKWMFEGFKKGKKIGDSNILCEDYRDFVKETFIRNVKMFAIEVPVYAVEEFSDDFFRMWESSQEVSNILGGVVKLGGEISFCYVDGKHSYEQVKKDFINVDKFLEKDGFILFDDSGLLSLFEGVKKLMKEIEGNNDYELVMKNPNYMFKKIKKK